MVKTNDNDSNINIKAKFNNNINIKAKFNNNAQHHTMAP
jgi:hypothetical protein